MTDSQRLVDVFNSVTGRAVDDNTVSVIEFESGAIAVNETSFTGYGGSYSLEIDGTDGGYRMPSPAEGVEIRSKHLDGRGWRKPELPAAHAKPVDQWIEGCVRGAPIEFGLGPAIELTELMEAAYVADREGRSVDIG